MGGIDRRRFIKLAASSAALAGTARVSGVAPALARSRRIVGVDLRRYPYAFPKSLRSLMRPDEPLLDAYARRYGETTARPDPTDFFFRYLPIPLFERALNGTLAREGSAARDLWLMHLVGYFGGIWFFKKLEESGASALAAPSAAPCSTADPTDGDFAAMVTFLRRSQRAAYGPRDDEALGFASSALREGGVLQALISIYGYNAGYTNAILVPDNRALPPPLNPRGPSLFSPPWNSIEFTPTGVFDATYPDFSTPEPSVAPLPPGPPGSYEPVPYLSGDSPGLRIARARFLEAQRRHPDRYRAVENGDPSKGEQPLGAMQAAAVQVGTTTWTAPGLLDVRRWDKASYVQLVGLSIFFLQATQLAGMSCASALTMQSGRLAREAALAAALVYPFGGSYLIGSGQRNNRHYCRRTSNQSVPPFRYG